MWWDKNSKWWKEKMVPEILMHKHYHQDTTFLMLPTWYGQLEATILKQAFWWCYCPQITIPMLSSQSYRHNATIPTLLSQCHHPDRHDAAVTALLTQESCLYHLIANIPMIPSWCNIPDDTISKHKCTAFLQFTNALTFFYKAERKAKDT